MKKFADKIPSVSWYLEGAAQEKAIGGKVVEMLGALSSKTGLGVELDIPHGEELNDSTILDRWIHVYIWGSPFHDTPIGRLEKVKIYEKPIVLYDKEKDEKEKHTDGEVGTRSDCYLVDEVLKGINCTYTKPIKDMNDKVLALVQNNRIYILFDIFHGIKAKSEESIESLDMFFWILQKAMKHLVVDKKTIQDEIENAPISSYVKGIIENSKKMLDKNRKELEDVSKNISQITKNLVVEQRRYDTINRYLSTDVVSGEKELIERCKNPIIGLLNNGYQSISWKGDSVVAHTDPIPVEHKGRKYPLGGFEITVGFDGSIVMKNTKNAKSGCDHPHIRHGIPCWGNVATSISKLVAQFEFLPILDIILLHLKSYNPKSAYVKLGLWSKKPCSKCGEDAEVCDCSKASSGTVASTF